MRTRPWWVPLVVFATVLVAQLVLVAGIGTDIPYQDQWTVEGRQLYPTWIDGTWRLGDLLAAHNEHRIAWTRALDLALFAGNGGHWDPLVQLAAVAVLRAAVAAVLAMLLITLAGFSEWWVMVGIIFAFLPHLAWQNAIWGFQSHVYFSLLFGIAALALLSSESDESTSPLRKVGGVLAGIAAMLSMGAGLMVPFALLGLVVVRLIERRRINWKEMRDAWPVWLLLVVAWGLHGDVSANAELRALSFKTFFLAFARATAWPHVWTPIAALGLNFPLLVLIGGRIFGRRESRSGESFFIVLGGWSAAMALAMAWTRGGSGEFDGGIPSRYADFLSLLVLANACAAVALFRSATKRRTWARIGGIAWTVFFIAGWAGLSAEVMSRLILPRLRDRDAPVRTMLAFQRTRDPAVFEGQPLLYVPDGNVVAVGAVLDDPRLRGKLPPSLQPREPLGPLSRMVRGALGR